MSGRKPGEKKRALRLADPLRAKSSKLFNFGSVNPLLYLDTAIDIDVVSPATSAHHYHYYGQACQLPHIAAKETDLKHKELLLPRKQRTRADPLADAVYSGFHKRMTKEERSMVESDRSRVMKEIENLRDQLRLLLQNDWVRQLPRITLVEDRKDMVEMARKRTLTQMEIRKLLNKYSDWEDRNLRLFREAKKFEASANGVVEATWRLGEDSDLSDDTDSDDSDDSDETILTLSLQAIKEERERKRIDRNGPSLRILLHNGYDILLQPDQSPRVVESGMYIS